LKFSPDDERLAVIRSDGPLEIWNVAEFRLETETTTAPKPFSLSWSGNGAFVVIGGDSVSEVKDVTTGDVVWTSRLGVQLSPTALDGDGGRVAAVRRVNAGPTSLGSTVDIWSTDDSTVLAQLQHPIDQFVCVQSFDPTGEKLATGTATGEITVWSLESLTSGADTPTLLQITEPVSVMRGPVGPVCALDWSSDGTRLLAGSSDGLARLWDVDSGRELLQLSGQGGQVTSVALANSSLEAVTTTADGVTRLWNTAPNLGAAETITESSSVYKVVYASGGDTIAVSTKERIALWNATTRLEILSVDDGEIAPRFPTMGVAVTDDGHIIVSPFIDLFAIGVYDTATGELLRQLSNPDEGPHEMLFLPGTHLLAVANQFARPVLWDVEDGTRTNFLWTGAYTNTDRWIDTTPDGQRIVTSGDGVSFVWESSTMDLAATLEHGETAPSIGDVAISPDGETVAVATSSGEVQLWDVETETVLRTLVGHVGVVNSVRFSPDGRLLATAGVDGTSRVWDTSSWVQERLFTGLQGSVKDLDFSPDGTTLVTAGEDGTIRFWTLDADTLIATARASVTRSLTEAECANYVPDGRCD